MKKFIAASATLVFMTLASSCWAQTVEQDGADDEYSVATERAQKTFLEYHKSIEAETDCRGVAFSQDDRLAMDRAIAQEMVSVSPQISMGAARLLNLRRMADQQMDHTVSHDGCDSKKVKKSLAFYDERLANVHPVPEAALPGPQGEAQPVSDQSPAQPEAGDQAPAQPAVAVMPDPQAVPGTPPDAAPQSLIPAAQP